MALKALKCPNCDANIQVDSDRDYGFCSYCGAQIQIKEVMEIHRVNSVQEGEFEKDMEAGEAFLKLEDYYRAEMLYMELLREYPGRSEVYERLICTITRNYTLFLIENMERVCKLMDKMILVAPEDKKQECEEYREKVVKWFSDGMLKQMQTDDEKEIARLNKMIRENIIIVSMSVVFAVAMFGLSKGFFALIQLGLLALLIAIWGVVMYLKNSRKKDQLIKRNQQMDESSL